ncbi:MAG TPA: winged helix-turn-helix transcriptional regulator [Nitrospirota bacterium]|nr:winged helix-turn-helix transcriptional regulator [Nitrospirota bacterium]
MNKNAERCTRANGKLLAPSEIRTFRKKIYTYYRNHGRDLPWRKTRNPYNILVSEIMLQQTQVERVLEKYAQFIKAFPDFSSLARAPLRKLITIWQGMGYNRRALALRALAQTLMNERHGKLPSDPEDLMAFPGIGRYTAGAVAAFAFNQPVLFIDTNIRRVFIHTFLHGRENIKDEDILPLIQQTIDVSDPRTWYNALMDYGAMLKREHANPNRRSALYQRQSPFENSNRQIRGRILKVLVEESPLSLSLIAKKSGMDPERVKQNLMELINEGFVRKQGKLFAL